MYTVLFIDASAAMLGRPARTALLPQIVPREVFPNAVTWNTSMMQMAWVIGPAIGGFIIAFSVPAAYVICATTSLVFILLLTRVHTVTPSEQVDRASLEVLLGGLKFLRKSRLILSLMSLDMFAVLLGGAVYLLPIFAEEILKVGPTGFGYLNAAPAAGAFCAAITMAHLPPMKRAGRNLLLAIAGFGAATVVFGFSQNFWLSFTMLFLTGVFDNVSMVVRHTYIQLLTPDEMRGRVSAVNYVFVSASNELGGLESGIVAHGFGPVVSVVSGGIGTIIVVLLTAMGVPGLRRMGSITGTEAPGEDESE
jgi:MFS family permease